VVVIEDIEELIHGHWRAVDRAKEAIEMRTFHHLSLRECMRRGRS
jgi:hypothetical protein